MKYGDGKWGDGGHYGDQPSSFTVDLSTSVSYSKGGAFGDGHFGMGVFGGGEFGSATITYANETPTTVIYG